jgi:predicted transcriptional regulator
VAEAARRLKVHRRTLYRWENGETAPSIEDLERFCNLAGGIITLEIGNTEAAPPSYWARRLREDATEISVLLEELAALQAGGDDTLPLQPYGGSVMGPPGDVRGGPKPQV